jgi:hypothetical protein
VAEKPLFVIEAGCVHCEATPEERLENTAYSKIQYNQMVAIL